MPIYALDGKVPRFEDEGSNWVAPDAVLIGNVGIGRDAGFWFGVVIRGDNEGSSSAPTPTCGSTRSCIPTSAFL